MKKILKFFGGLLLILFIIGSVSMFVPFSNEIIHLRVAKVYTIGLSTKCYDLVPNGKYQDLNHVTIYGDTGSQLKIDQQVDLIIIKK
jgi:hypothetical protein